MKKEFIQIVIMVILGIGIGTGVGVYAYAKFNYSENIGPKIFESVEMYSLKSTTDKQLIINLYDMKYKAKAFNMDIIPIGIGHRYITRQLQ